MQGRVILFAIATLCPLPLMSFGAMFGGVWIIAAFVYLTWVTLLLDALVATGTPANFPDTEFPAATPLAVVLALAHFPLLALAIYSLANTDLTLWERALVFLSFGMFFGQVSNSNAHELIHRQNRILHSLGKWVYISLLFGHHTSAHPKIHHRFVASMQDPNSAPLGQSFYRFAPNAWIGSFKLGLATDTKLYRNRPAHQHPYVTYVGGAICALALSLILGGLTTLAAYLCIAAYSTAQLLLSDYVQHYGLHRKTNANGRLEPIAPQHSWNAPHWFTGHLMLNAPRHSDHHAHPSTPFPNLTINGALPTLPYSLPTMAAIALFPRRWHRLMDKRAAHWNTE